MRGETKSGLWVALALLVLLAGARAQGSHPALDGGSENASLPAAGAADNALLPAAGAEVVDRTIALVNSHLVTWSDLDEQMRFEALENQRPLKNLTETDRSNAFNHLVQNWILSDQMQGTVAASEADVDARIAEIRELWGMVPHIQDDDAKWAATVNRYGLSAEELRSLVANQLELLRFLEFRVRPLVRVSRQEVDDYYSGTLSPQVRAQGQTPGPEEQVSDKIRELLEEQKMNAEMEKWLDSLRSQSRVRVLWDGVR